MCDRVSVPLPLLVYSPECLEGDFCELRAEGSKTLNRQGYKDFVKKMNVPSERLVWPRHER